MNEVAKRILDLMSERDMSYGDLAKATGIPKSALQRYATGETAKIPLDRIELIAKALGIDATILTGWHTEEDDNTAGTGPAYDDEANELMREMYERPELRALFKTTRRVTPDAIRAVDKLLKQMAGEDDD